jgi:hypothetical protein
MRLAGALTLLLFHESQDADPSVGRLDGIGGNSAKLQISTGKNSSASKLATGEAWVA